MFTDLQIRQIQLARTAFQIEVLQNGLRKKIVDMVKTAARCDFEEYLAQIQRERSNAEEAIKISRSILFGKTQKSELFMTRKDTSENPGITMDVLRKWEMNGLLAIKRKENGYRVYTSDDIQRLKIIRSLRCAN